MRNLLCVYRAYLVYTREFKNHFSTKASLRIIENSPHLAMNMHLLKTCIKNHIESLIH